MTLADVFVDRDSGELVTRWKPGPDPLSIEQLELLIETALDHGGSRIVFHGDDLRALDPFDASYVMTSMAAEGVRLVVRIERFSLTENLLFWADELAVGSRRMSVPDAVKQQRKFYGAR